MIIFFVVSSFWDDKKKCHQLGMTKKMMNVIILGQRHHFGTTFILLQPKCVRPPPLPLPPPGRGKEPWDSDHFVMMINDIS